MALEFSISPSFLHTGFSHWLSPLSMISERDSHWLSSKAVDKPLDSRVWSTAQEWPFYHFMIIRCLYRVYTNCLTEPLWIKSTRQNPVDMYFCSLQSVSWLAKWAKDCKEKDYSLVSEQHSKMGLSPRTDVVNKLTLFLANNSLYPATLTSALTCEYSNCEYSLVVSIQPLNFSSKNFPIDSPTFFWKSRMAEHCK